MPSRAALVGPRLRQSDEAGACGGGGLHQLARDSHVGGHVAAGVHLHAGDAHAQAAPSGMVTATRLRISQATVAASVAVRCELSRSGSTSTTSAPTIRRPCLLYTSPSP